jgi:hypothetical protein
MYLQLDHVSPRSASIVEIKGINQSIGRTTLLIYNYCRGNCRWYLTIIHCFLKLRLQISSICVTFSSHAVRKTGRLAASYWCPT